MKDSFNNMTLAELEKKKADLTKENFNLRVNRVYGSLENPMALRTTRRKIARINTRISEIKLGIRAEKKGSEN